jgi:hypothetical protein
LCLNQAIYRLGAVIIAYIGHFESPSHSFVKILAGTDFYGSEKFARVKFMENNPNKLSFVNVFIGVGVYCAVMALAYMIWMAVIWQKQNSQAKTLARIETTLELVRQKTYEKQNAGIFGGKTPAETIYLYYEFLESRTTILLSTYFIPEKRQVEQNRFDGVSEKNILQFVEKLRAAEAVAKKDNPSKSPYIMTSPVEMKLQKMSNGVWEFEYINYDLKS